MFPIEPPDEFARHLAEQRARMMEARTIAYLAHSRTGLMVRYLRRLADRIDPTDKARRRSH